MYAVMPHEVNNEGRILYCMVFFKFLRCVQYACGFMCGSFKCLFHYEISWRSRWCSCLDVPQQIGKQGDNQIVE